VWAESMPGRGATSFFTLPNRMPAEDLLQQHCV
jgi:hypothetical protein